jgi:hypothetical protein
LIRGGIGVDFWIMPVWSLKIEVVLAGGNFVTGINVHMLIAYNAGNNVVNIADVDFVNASGSNQTSTANVNVYASDMVSLTGVSADFCCVARETTPPRHERWTRPVRDADDMTKPLSEIGDIVEPGSVRGWEIDISATALGHSSYQESRLPNSLSGGKIADRFIDARIKENSEGIADC